MRSVPGIHLSTLPSLVEPHGNYSGFMTARVTLYTRQGCHLCGDARAVVEEVSRASGVDYLEVDVDTDPALRERYGDEVPVVTVDGDVVGFWRIDAQSVFQALQ